MTVAGPAANAPEPSQPSQDSGHDRENKYGMDSLNQDSVSSSDVASDIRIEEEEGVVKGRPAAANTKVDAAALEVEYRYLTFETPLPTPNTIPSPSRSLPAAHSPPPQPSLAAFMDPHRWPSWRKNVMLALSCIATTLTAYSAGSFSPPVARMSQVFGASQIVILFSGMTIFCLGFALTPMLLAPFSEFNGRYPVFVVSGIVYVAFQAVSGASPDLAAMLISRALVGCGGSVFSTMVGGVIADVWHAEERNTPMALFSGFVLLGTGLGPLVSSVIVYHTTYPQNPNDLDPTDPSLRAPWRWVFWHQVIAGTVLMICLVTLFKESRGSVLLSRRARVLNKWYEDLETCGYYGVWVGNEGAAQHRGVHNAPETDEEKVSGEDDVGAGGRQLRRLRWKVKDDEDRTTLVHMMAVSVYRPFHMFFTEPVVFFFSLWVAFSWAILYLMFGSIFLVMENAYSWNMEEAGRAFSAMLIGAALSTVIGVYQDRVLFAVVPTRLRVRMKPDAPEARLYVACMLSVLLPIGLFMFGFTARPDVHWMVPIVAIGLATMGIYSVYLATFNYLADVYHRFASSALAAQSCCRNLLGGVFPLVMRALFLNLGNGRAGALLGGVAMGLTLVPWVLVGFGEQIRLRSKFAMALKES